MPGRRNAAIDDHKDAILQMDKERLPLDEIRSRLSVKVTRSTLQRRLREWRRSDLRRIDLTTEEEERIKARIPDLVFKHFCGDKELFEKLQQEGYKIGSIGKVRQLRKAAGIPRRHNVNDPEYDFYLAAEVKKILDENEGDIKFFGRRHLYPALRLRGLCVPQQRLQTIINDLNPRNVAQRALLSSDIQESANDSAAQDEDAALQFLAI